jgi:hypothetical protein
LNIQGIYFENMSKRNRELHRHLNENDTRETVGYYDNRMPVAPDEFSSKKVFIDGHEYPLSALDQADRTILAALYAEGPEIIE